MGITSHFAGRSNQHSSYPKVSFLAIKLLQLVSCLVGFAIVSYFVARLRGSHMHVPWSFIVHDIVYAASILVLAITIGFHAPRIPAPTISVIVDGILLAILATSFGILAHSLRVTIASGCSVELWNNSTGIMVCRLYKALFSFAAFSVMSTAVGLILDLYVLLTERASGVYVRTQNPKSTVIQESDSEYRGLTQPSHVAGYEINNSDDGVSSFPSTPGLQGEGAHDAPSGRDIDGEEMELTSFLAPSTAYSRGSQRGYKLPEEDIRRHHN